MTKKIFIVMLLFVSFMSFCVTAYELPETLRVGLYYGSSAKENVTITCDGETSNINCNELAETLIFESAEPISVNGNLYRGSIEVLKNSNGLLNVINIVPLETYIATVTAKEMSPSFNYEALKVQAICARTYAVANIGRHKSYGFDMCSTTDCQYYGGVSAEHENTNRATQDTKGMVITYNGKIINAVYSATSGGYTENSEAVWGNAYPYLVGVEDKWESKNVYGSSWTREYTAEELTAFCEKMGYNIGNVQNVEIISSTPTGCVTEIKITGDAGVKTAKNYSCQGVFGWDKLLSQAYTVTPPGTTERKADIKTVAGNIAKDIYFISSSGKVKSQIKKLTFLGSSSKTEVSLTSEENSGNKYVFKGRGYGHLVGMSQNGANGMAGAGFTYEEIIKHYYQGTEIE